MERDIKFSLLFQHDSTGNIVEKKWTLYELLDGVKENTMPPTWHLIVARQYTGLKDKNGRDIFEGDIVREQRKRFKDKHFVLKWNNGIGSYTFKPVDKNATSWPSFNTGTVENLEVVGNIYENPELLKEGE